MRRPEDSLYTNDPSGKRDGAGDELKAYIRDIADRKLQNVPFYDWPIMSDVTQALTPGNLTMLVGDPGVGKTFVILGHMLPWIANDHNPACLFIEKGKVFYSHRLLAMLENEGHFVDWKWLQGDDIKGDGPASDKERADRRARIDKATENHREFINLIGKHVWSQPAERLTLKYVQEWIAERCAEGHRIIVVDPITAANAGDKRWLADDDFVMQTQKIIGEAGASLILVTHSKGNFTAKTRSGFGQAGGTAYFKFSDTDIWLVKEQKPKRVELKRSSKDVAFKTSLSVFAEIHKARNGRGSGARLGFSWEKMRFVEQGVVMREVPEKQDEDEQ